MVRKSTVDRRRKNPRIDLEAKIDFSNEHSFYTGFTSNLSEGGVFIATFNLFPLGTVLKFRFTLPDNPDESVEMVGEVRWLREYNESYSDVSPGMGVKFIDLDADVEKRINGFCDRKEPLFYDDDDDFF